jgi:hypothetical protein
MNRSLRRLFHSCGFAGRERIAINPSQSSRHFAPLPGWKIGGHDDLHFLTIADIFSDAVIPNLLTWPGSA